MFESISNELMWFLCGFILLLSEFMIPGFVIFFFGVGAWVVALLLWSNIDISFTSQLFIFLTSSLVSLTVFRKYGSPYFRGKVSQIDTTSFDDVKGEKATVTSDIEPRIGGKVEFHGTQWNAEADTRIPKGSVVEVLERDNLTLKVKPLQ